MYAVTIEPLRSVYFVSHDPGQSDEWSVVADVDLDFPSNYDLWREGSPMPEQVVCVSKIAPNHFKVYKYSRDVDTDRFQSTGKLFGGIYSRQTWERFRAILPSRLNFAKIPDDESASEIVNTTGRKEGAQ